KISSSDKLDLNITSITAGAVRGSLGNIIHPNNSLKSTQFQKVTLVGSLTFKSTIDNGIVTDKQTFNKTSAKDYIDHRDPTFECSSCGALLWYAEILEPPLLLKELITNKHPKSASFIDNIRRYNSMFALTSMSGKQDMSVNIGRGPYYYRLHGENYHLAGALLHAYGKPGKFAQLYIFDTENEIQNIIRAVSNGESSSSRNNELDYQLTTDIRDLLDEINPLVQDFRMAGERIRSLDDEKISLRIIVTSQRDGRQYNLPMASEVAALIVGDFDSTKHKRDIILHCQDDDFKRINESHPSYLALHYPLFYPYGEDNYHSDIFHEGVTDYYEKNKGTRVAMKQYFAYRIQERKNKFSMMLNRRSLFQQFIVDAYTMIESERLTFNRKNDKDLISETYSKLATLAHILESGVKLRGKKLDCLMKELNDGHIFGRVKGVVYTIEFQKRGLPHCHISLWLESEDKITTTGKIDEYIAEIPNKDEDPELYQLVTDHMMHGPCGADNPSCPCMIEYKCTKKFPRQFNETTVIDDSGYALYKRRNDGNIIKKSGTDLHNSYVGPDRVSATVDGEEVDEIKDFLNCRYLSPCEAAWRIYVFEIHYRTPSIERFPFHLKDEHYVIFDATESIDYDVDKSSVNETKFESWMELNQTDTFARTLLYVVIPKFYVWNQKQRIWTRRKQEDRWNEMTGRRDCVGKTWMKLAEDVLNVERIKQGIPDLELSDIQRKNICLSYIECMLRSNNRSLKDIQNMPYPDQKYMMDGYNRLIYDETSYDKDQLREQHVKLYGSLTTEQKGIYSTVMDAVDNNKGGIIVVKRQKDSTFMFCYPNQCSGRFNVPHSGGSDLADLIRKANLIIWDEAPMINRHCYKAYDRTLRDICRTDPSVASDKVFGGKVVLLVVILDKYFQSLLMAVDMMKSTIVFPDNMLIPEIDDDVGAIIDDTYPNFLQNLWNPSFFKEKAILAPTHEMVDIINERMLSLLLGDENEYESSDSVCLADEESNFDDSIYTTEFLNGLRMSSIPNHSIMLKIGTLIMLMRNINQRAGLCNGTRHQVLRLGINIIEAQIISGGSVGKICAIPRMVISPTDTKMLFKLNRRQFPIQVCFAMTINKSQ
nr:uncharacterized protein [Tanacetum cinerariifolium]